MIIHYENGTFWAESSFDERHALKEAGFRWHGQLCMSGCKACAAGIPAKSWWSADVTRAARLEHVCDEAAVAEIEEAKRRLAESRATDADITVPAPEGLDYLPFQRAGIKFALERGRVLIGDEMGLGKTIQGLGLINADESIRRVLVLCPASLRLNWAREAERWLVRPMRVWVVESKDVPPEWADIVIVNYDRIRKGPVLEWIGSRDWDLLIADEAHRLKNPKAQQTRAVLGGGRQKGRPNTPGLVPRAARILLLTGTPMLNRPIELQPLAGALAPDEFGHFFAFARRYANAYQGRFGWDFSGASNLEELQDRLRSTIMIRRLKREVLTELPAKRRQVMVMPANGALAAVEAEREAWRTQEEILAERRADVELSRALGDDEAYNAAVDALRDAARIAFTEISKVRHLTALAKVPSVLDHAREALEATDGKIVIMAHHSDVIEQIADGLEAYTPLKLTGATPMADRQAVVDRFQDEADPCRVFIGSITAAGVGLTLTASSHVIFAELDWVPANITQAEDRVHRIGQAESVLVQHLVLDGSLDARMAKAVVAKQEIADRTLDIADRDALKVPAVPGAPLMRHPKKYPVPSDEVRAAAHAAVRFLAARCDGAFAEDGAGYNKIDSPLGKKLAGLESLSDGQTWLAAKLARKYRGQLPDALNEALGTYSGKEDAE